MCLCSFFQILIVLLVMVTIHGRSILHTRDIDTVTWLHSSISMPVKLYSKTLMFLQITQDGQVSGNLDCNSKYGKNVVSAAGSPLFFIFLGSIKGKGRFAGGITGIKYTTIILM